MLDDDRREEKFKKEEEKVIVPEDTSKSFASFFKQFFKSLGPGVVTGGSDNDPSGIATYSQAGAQFGYGLLWMGYSYPSNGHDSTRDVCKNWSYFRLWVISDNKATLFKEATL